MMVNPSVIANERRERGNPSNKAFGLLRRILLLAMTIFFMFTNDSNASLDIDISEPNLEISAGFTGDALTLFGTAKPKGDIIIIVKGPTKDTTIRRKVDILGLWISGRSVVFKDVPQYYNVASSKPVLDIVDNAMRLEKRMGINSLTFETADKETEEKTSRFTEALIQNKQLKGLYSLTPDAVEFINDSLFKTTIYMPSNVPIGDYTIETFLLQNGNIIDQETHPFQVEQVGITADIHDFALDKPFLYGLSVILAALLSSFLAILLLRRE